MGAFINMNTMYRQDYVDLPLFEGLLPEQIGQIIPIIDEVRYDRDAVVFEQGQPADCLYILAEGEVVVRYKPYDGPPLIVTRIPSGGVFGWSSVLGRDVYTSASIAATKIVAYRISSASLMSLCGRNPDLGHILLERLAGVIAERMRNTHVSVLQLFSQGMETNGNFAKRIGEK